MGFLNQDTSTHESGSKLASLTWSSQIVVQARLVQAISHLDTGLSKELRFQVHTFPVLFASSTVMRHMMDKDARFGLLAQQAPRMQAQAFVPAPQPTCPAAMNTGKWFAEIQSIPHARRIRTPLCISVYFLCRHLYQVSAFFQVHTYHQHSRVQLRSC